MTRTRLVHLAFCAAMGSTYMFGPSGWQTAIYLICSASATIAILVGIWIHRPSKKAPWLLIAGGFAMYIAGDGMYALYESHYGVDDVPFPNLSDIPYLLFYPMLFFGLAQFLKLRAQRDRAAWLDASIWTVAVAVLAWEPLIESYALDSESGLAARLVALAYPLLDLGLLLMALRMIAGRLVMNPAYLLLSAAMFLQTLSDIVYAAQALDGSYVGGGLLDMGWVLTYFAIGAAALHPSMLDLTLPAKHREVVSSHLRLATLGLAGFVAPALLVFQISSGDVTGEVTDVVAVVAAITVLLCLLLARGGGILNFAQRRAAELLVRQDELEDVMADRESIIEQLNRQVSHDTLTGLASRDRFVEAVEAALAAGSIPSLAFLDLDDFKSINDTLGHDAGDQLLRQIAVRLKSGVRPQDLVARFGGDEFAVLFEGEVEPFVTRVLDAVQQPMKLLGRELHPRVSIGVTTAKSHESVAGDLLREADVAMYTAKRAGGGWASYRAGMSALLLERINLHARIVDAVRDAEIVPWFQPVVDLVSGQLHGFEALARWCPPNEPVRPPDTWLPLAEETGLIVTVDRAVFRAAVTHFCAWRAHYTAGELHLAVNLSARTLQHQGIAEEMIEVLAELGLPPDRLVVEVTEGVLIEDDRVSARLQILRAAGVRVALDDFGTGWSSLSYLRRFPVDQLKLDRSFTAELATVLGGDAIPAAVVQLARALHLEVVAEGVETEQQRLRLIELGFRTAQGYLFGRAMPAHLVVSVLDQANRPAASTASTRLRLLADRPEVVLPSLPARIPASFAG